MPHHQKTLIEVIKYNVNITIYRKSTNEMPTLDITMQCGKEVGIPNANFNCMEVGKQNADFRYYCSLKSCFMYEVGTTNADFIHKNRKRNLLPHEQ